MTRGEREGWRLGPRQQRTTRRRGGRRASPLCSGTRGDGRLCDALIILKQSLAGRPCIVQKSRGNSEKEEVEGGWSVCRLANDTRLGRAPSSMLLSRVYEIPGARILHRLIDRVHATEGEIPLGNRRKTPVDTPTCPMTLPSSLKILPLSPRRLPPNQPLFRQLKHRSTDIRSRFLVVVVRGIADIGPKMCPIFIGTYVYTNFLYIYTRVE